MRPIRLSLKQILLLTLVAALGCALCGLLAFWGFKTLMGPPPGVGEKAERGYQTCQPIIEALEAYQTQEGGYPATLEELRPRYVDEIPEEVNGYPLEYRKTEDGYSLEFSYEGPGMNHCTYTPAKGWD